ncbi:MAG: hypothetical protein ACUVWJ_00020 [Spirochaetota bacterium]
MRYRFLGKTGLKVSEIALGTQTFGWGADEKKHLSLLTSTEKQVETSSTQLTFITTEFQSQSWVRG